MSFRHHCFRLSGRKQGEESLPSSAKRKNPALMGGGYQTATRKPKTGFQTRPPCFCHLDAPRTCPEGTIDNSPARSAGSRPLKTFSVFLWAAPAAQRKTEV